MPSVGQFSLAGGEVTPSIFGRIDLARYQNSLKTCRNFITRTSGGAVNRPGTKFIAEVKDSTKKARGIPFEFNTTQTYGLIFGDQNMRVVKDGGVVLESSKAITATTNATPVVVTSNAHGNGNGNQVFIAGTGIAALDNRYWTVAGAAANTFQLSGSTAPGSTSATGTVARVFELATPYLEADLPLLDGHAHSVDVKTICHQSYQPRQLSRTAHDAWSLGLFDFKEGPFQEINTANGKGVTSLAETGTGVTVTASHAIFASANVGQLFYIEQKDFGKPWEPGKGVALGDIRVADGRYYKSRTAGTPATGTLRPSHDVVGDTESDGTVTWEFMHNGFGIALITAFTDSKNVVTTILNQIPTDATTTAPETITGAANNGAGLIRITDVGHPFTDDQSIMLYGVGGTVEANGVWKINKIDANHFDLPSSAFVNAYTSGGKATSKGTYKYAFGAWGGDQSWPAASTYHQQRQFFAATPQAPTKTWGSETNAYSYFGKSVPLKADDAVSFRIAGAQVNAIRHMRSLRRLVLFTQGSEHVISGGDNDVIAPNAISADPHGYNGCSTVRPLLVGDMMLFLQDKGRIVRDIGFQLATDSYTGSDLTVLATHLFKQYKITAWAYQKTPFICIWARREDGIFLGLTYMREQQILGWHRHDSAGDECEDIWTGSEGEEDAVYFIFRRTISGVKKRYIERLASRAYTDPKDAFFVDSGLTYDGRNLGATTMTLSGGTTWNYQTETFTLTASASQFAASQVGVDEIHMTAADGTILRLAIIGFTSATVVTVRADHNVPADLRSVALAAWGRAKKVFTGADHLEGRTISVLADAQVVANGTDLPLITVSAGGFSIPNHAVVVHMGLPITADLETLNLSVSSPETILDKQKIVSAVKLMVEESRSIWAGPDADHLTECKQRREEAYDEPVDPLTGLAPIRVASTWSTGGRVFVRQKDPLPISVLAVIPEVDVGGAG